MNGRCATLRDERAGPTAEATTSFALFKYPAFRQLAKFRASTPDPSRDGGRAKIKGELGRKRPLSWSSIKGLRVSLYAKNAPKPQFRIHSTWPLNCTGILCGICTQLQIEIIDGP